MGNRFRDKLARFLYGRNGVDNLYNALSVAELIVLFISTVFNVLGYIEPIFAVISIVLYIVALGMIIWSIFRFFSRNIAARQRENAAWLRFKGRFRRKPRRKKAHLPADTADHIFRSCKHCKATLRLPRQPGKHEVKCPRCGGRFKVKVKAK